MTAEASIAGVSPCEEPYGETKLPHRRLDTRDAVERKLLLHSSTRDDPILLRDPKRKPSLSGAGLRTGIGNARNHPSSIDTN
jgi:hypothetical protein